MVSPTDKQTARIQRFVAAYGNPETMISRNHYWTDRIEQVIAPLRKRIQTLERQRDTKTQNIARFNSRPGRLITVAGVKWRWRCGSGFSIIAYSERGDRVCGTAPEIAGCTVSTFERGQRKKTSDGALTPKQVEAWLLRQP